MFRIFLGIGVLALSFFHCEPDTHPWTPEKESILFKKLLQEGFRGHVLLSQGDKTLLETSVKETISPNEPFPLGDLTQHITATAILYLKDQNQLQLTDSVANHLPEFPFPQVTIQHLLSHQSGLPRLSELYPRGIPSNWWEIYLANPSPPSFPPGNYWNYTRMDYFLLGKIIETVSVKSYFSFVKEIFFLPHGLNSITWNSKDPLLGSSGIFLSPIDFQKWMRLRKKLYPKEITEPTVHFDGYTENRYNAGMGFYTDGSVYWKDGHSSQGTVLFYSSKKENLDIFIFSKRIYSKSNLMSIKSHILETHYQNKLVHLGSGKVPKDKISLEEALSLQNVPAVSITIVKDFKIHWSETIGVLDKNTGEVAHADSVFRAGSITKVITAIVAINLLHRNPNYKKENLMPLFQKWGVQNSTQKAVSLFPEDILSHTSGLTEKPFWTGKKKENPSHIYELEPFDFKVYYTPKSKSQYSGGAYCLLAEWMEQRTNSQFQELVQSKILKPLGLRHSHWKVEDIPQGQSLAQGHQGSDFQVIPSKLYEKPEWASGGLLSHSRDLARVFLDIQIAKKMGSSKTLPPQTVDFLLHPVISAANLSVQSQIGRGIFLNPPYFYHGGHTMGHKSFALFHESKGYGVVIMTNSEEGSPLIWYLIRSLIVQENWDKFVN